MALTYLVCSALVVFATAYQRQASRFRDINDGIEKTTQANLERKGAESDLRSFDEEHARDVAEANRRVGTKRFIKLMSTNSSAIICEEHGNAANQAANAKFNCRNNGGYSHCPNDHLESCPSGQTYYCGPGCTACNEICSTAWTCDETNEPNDEANKVFGCRTTGYSHCPDDQHQSCPSGETYYCGPGCTACNDFCGTPTGPNPVFGTWTITRNNKWGGQKVDTGVCGKEDDVFHIAFVDSVWCNQKHNSKAQVVVNQDGKERTWGWFCSNQPLTSLDGTPTFVPEGSDGPCRDSHNAMDDGA